MWHEIGCLARIRVVIGLGSVWHEVRRLRTRATRAQRARDKVQPLDHLVRVRVRGRGRGRVRFRVRVGVGVRVGVRVRLGVNPTSTPNPYP